MNRVNHWFWAEKNKTTNSNEANQTQTQRHDHTFNTNRKACKTQWYKLDLAEQTPFCVNDQDAERVVVTRVVGVRLLTSQVCAISRTNKNELCTKRRKEK